MLSKVNDSVAWGTMEIEMPISLPVLSHVSLPSSMREKDDVATNVSGLGLSLDLLDSENLDFSTLALQVSSHPSFGLVSDAFAHWSFNYDRISHLSSTQIHSQASEATTSVNTPVSSSIPFSSSFTAPSSSPLVSSQEKRSNDQITSFTTSDTVIQPEIRAKHFAQNSRLSEAQHRLWWSTRHSLPQTNVNDPLKVAVAAEQRLFKESMKRMVLETCVANFNHFAPPISACMMQLWKQLKEMSLKYAPYYTPSGNIGHTYLDPRHAPPTQISNFSPTQIFDSLGSTFCLPQLATPILHSVTLPRTGDFWLPIGASRADKKFTRDEAKLAEGSNLDSTFENEVSGSAQTAHANASASSKTLPTFLKQIQPPVASDAFVRQILAKRHCQIVVSSSTLTRITCSGIEEAWEVPISVEEVLGEDHQLRKVVFLDKALVPRDLSIKQQNTKFFKMSLKRWLIQNQNALDVKEVTGFTKSSLTLDQHAKASPQHEFPDLFDSKDNLVYSEWKLGTMTLLLRQRIDGVTSIQRSPTQSQLVPTKIVSKMKHVPDHNLEEFSQQERAKYLLKTHLLGAEARVLVGHVDPATARLLSLESLTNQQLRGPGASSMEYYFTQIHDVLAWCKTLSPGQFLLSHASGEFKITASPLYEKKEDVKFAQGIAATYNLHERQQEAAKTNTEILEYLPPRWDFHRINQIPNTFPPAAKTCCFDFIKNGKCGHPESCQRIHISKYEAELRGMPTPTSHAPHQEHATLRESSPQANDKKRRRTNYSSPDAKKKAKYR